LLIIDVPLVVPETPISFDQYIVPRGLQPGENALPEDNSSGSLLPPLNQSASAQLQEMGFSAVRAEKALRMTGNDNAEIAMQWLFEHMEDPDIDVPFAPAAPQQGVVDPEKVTDLMGMGFDEPMAKKALQETVRHSFPLSTFVLTFGVGRQYGTSCRLVIFSYGRSFCCFGYI
jgi:ubiquitin carboxyl-terminal hydrolase 5/13